MARVPAIIPASDFRQGAARSQRLEAVERAGLHHAEGASDGCFDESRCL